jgi:rhamnulokinase
MTSSLVAVDLGATSGRVIRGEVSSRAVVHETVHRFPNGPVEVAGSLHWNVTGLFNEVLAGLALIGQHDDQVAGIGIDSWAVDYGLVRHGELLQEPFHYRDARTLRGVEAIHSRQPFDQLFLTNGLQFLPFNTVYQLATEDWNHVAGQADHLLLVPDLMGYWLTGNAVTELTNASTTGLLQVGADSWSEDLIQLTGAPRHLFGPLVAPGHTVGALTAEMASRVGFSATVLAVGSHDTASAVQATPLASPNSAYLSLGTWGLVGLEVEHPILTDSARRENFTNERAVDGSIRFLKNVMGLWILNECVSTWRAADPTLTLESLVSQVAQMSADTPLIDVNDPVFAPPGNMPDRVDTWLVEHGFAPASSPQEMTNILVSSLAHAYADTARTAGALAGVELDQINIVGGGSQNVVLCQRVANLSGVPVVAGPVEATALGNLMVQALALGMISGDREVIRDVVRRSAPPVAYSPQTERNRS